MSPPRRDWIRKQKRDPYYRKARHGCDDSTTYRSRAAFKLLQIEKKFQLFRKITRDRPPVLNIVDLCCAPGSFLEAMKTILTNYHFPKDRVNLIGVDCARVAPIEDVTLIQLDLFGEEFFTLIGDATPGELHIVTADCAPKLSGDKTWDVQNVIALAERALELATRFLVKGGCFVTKLFQGVGYNEFIARAGKFFESVKTTKPAASRSESREMYCVGIGYLK